jgi:predicted acyl esterase
MFPRTWRALLGALLIAAALLAVPQAKSQPLPAGYAYSDSWFASTDGTQLHAGVFLPADHKPGEKHPVLLVSTPYASPNGGASAAPSVNTTGSVNRFPELFTHPAFKAGRWAYLQVDVRGFGGSGGCFGYYMAPEAADVKVAVEWAAGQAWSTGKVGMWGKSYDAAEQVLALASRPNGLAATVIQEPGLSGYTALWMNGVHYATGRYATTGVYTADDVAPAQNQSTATSPEYAQATAAGLTATPTCRSDALANMNAIGDRSDPFWAAKEPYKGAKGAEIPTFWQHGFFDANTKPEFVDIWETLAGPKQAWFGQFTHVRGHENGVGRRGFLDEAFRFLDLHVRGVSSEQVDPAVTVQSGNGAGAWRAEAAWPPADASTWQMPVRPGTYQDEPGGAGDGSAAGKAHWTVTKPLPNDAHLAGEPRLKVPIAAPVPGVHLVAHLYDVAPNGTATLVSRGALATKAASRTAAFTLYPQDWVFEAGHRIGIHLSGSDDDWFSPGVTMTDVAVSAGTLDLPLLRYIRDEFLDGGPSDAMTSDSPFAVPAATLTAATVDTPAPPAQEKRPS